MMKKHLLSIALSLCIFSSYAQSQWDTNPASANNPVISTNAQEQNKILVTDGANGVIVISQSYNFFSFPFTTDINAQKVNSDGVVQWGDAATPKSVYTREGEATDTFINLSKAISDGNGGAYIAWEAFIQTQTDTFANLHIQHINNLGNKLWAATGLKVNSDVAGRGGGAINLCPDGSGGVVVVWDESVFDHPTQFTTYSQVFAQRYNSAGAKQWGANGVQVCTAAGIRGGASAVNDGTNNFVIYFADARSSNHYSGPDGEIFDNADIYAQKLNSSGALQWTANGIVVSNAALNQFPVNGFDGGGNAIADGAGGTIVLFDQYKLDSAFKNKYFAQRLNGSGTRQWATAGVTVCNIDSAKFLIRTFSDGAAGMVAVWSDARNGGGFLQGFETFAQRITSTGTASWTADGINVLSGEATDYNTPAVTDDGSGNYIFTWSRPTNGGAGSEVVAKKINNSGAQQWGASAKQVCNNADALAAAPSVIKSNNGSTIVAWLDDRNNSFPNFFGSDVYAGKLGANGSLGGGGVITPTTYTFTGVGDWNVAANWSNSTIPPSTLPSGSTIIIASADFLCRLNVAQTISAGATLIVNAGNNLVIQGSLTINQ